MAQNELAVKVKLSRELRDAIERMIQKVLDEGPYCPFCRTKLVRIHVECHDQSGWIHGWTCNCPGNERAPEGNSE